MCHLASLAQVSRYISPQHSEGVLQVLVFIFSSVLTDGATETISQCSRVSVLCLLLG